MACVFEPSSPSNHEWYLYDTGIEKREDSDLNSLLLLVKEAPDVFKLFVD